MGSTVVMMVCAMEMLLNGEVGAQTAAPSAASAGSAASSGVQLLPIPVPIAFPNQGGFGGASSTNPLGTTYANNPFSNPLAAPMLYGSMLPMSPSQTAAQAQVSSQLQMPGGMSTMQMGMLMLATQQPLGIGSGRLSGARGSQGDNSKQSRSPQTASTANSKPHGSGTKPGGLAARYFNRSSSRSPYPQSYYNRQTRYFP
jgi:hypothetical protein